MFPNADGTCPPDHRIKAKLRSGLFHEPGMAAYERTIKALVDQKIISKAPEGAYTTMITDKL